MTVDLQRAVAAVATAVLLATPGSVLALPRVLFTVDVESQALPLPQQVDTICENGSACGLMEIARLLRERGVAGTFFLNVYEYRKWGEPAMREIAVKLQAAGHDVALHTHPEYAYDPMRKALYEYSLDEQFAIIQEGTQLLTAWTGRPVVAHRAGDYAADERTLEALRRNGVRIDSSLFWGHPRCRLTGLNLPRNLPSSLGKLTEIPVTVYERHERPRFLGTTFAPVASVRKVDIDWFLDEREAKSAIDAIVEANPPFLVVFLHSFSLLQGRGDGVVPVPNWHARDILRAVLDRATEKGLEFVTMRDLVDTPVLAVPLRNQDIVPRIEVRVGLGRYIWHRMRAARLGSTALGTVGVLALVVIGTAVVTARRRKPPVDVRKTPPQGGTSMP